MTGLEAVALVALVQVCIWLPLCAVKYLTNNNNKSDNRASAQTGGRVHGR